MITVGCFKGLPYEYESFLIEKYDSCVVTCSYIEIFHETTDINYMLMHENGTLVALLIFDIKGDTAICLNALTKLNQYLFTIFSKHLFDNYHSIKKIAYPFSYNNYSLNNSVLTVRSDDYTLQLPSSIDDYFQQLGSSTRSNVRKHKNKLLRDYPQAKFITKIRDEIDENVVDRILQLNFDRIKSKKEIPHENHTHVKNYYKYTQHYGCVSYIEIDGLIVAGCIAFMSNQSMYSYFVAHDNNFSLYNAGQLCMVYLVEISIEKGFSALHLLSGECDYKTRFLAKPIPMYSYIVFKAFSLHFIISKVHELYSRTLYRFKLSKYAIPLKKTLKVLRKKSTKQLCKLEYIVVLFGSVIPSSSPFWINICD